MPYDLHGNYYASRRDAENAEMAQCAAIDLDITKQEMKQQQERQEREEHNIWQYIHMLEERITILEGKLNHGQSNF